MEKKDTNLDTLRHSVSHILAQAVKELYPEVRLGIGPSIENGFYYDFDRERPFTPQDLMQIEERMRGIIAQNLEFEKTIISREEAARTFKDRGEPYKVELLEEIQEEEVSIYRQGSFVDLCRGPHISSAGDVQAFKLLSVAGAYWRGDEKNRMLQRIYGTAFPTQKELDEYLHRLEEIELRDHRKLGKKLDLFSINEDIGAGLILWHPKGALIRKIIEDFWRDEHLKGGYELLYTPHIAKIDLWKRSGHLEFYSDYMYSAMDVDGVNYEVKPMNCPFHIAIYKSKLRSYRELPIRWAELGAVYRYEKSGVLHGLLRVRGFTQDDAHIFCMESQLEDEIKEVLRFTFSILKTFGFDKYEIYLSTRPEKFAGTIEDWEKATVSLTAGLKSEGCEYEIDLGEGVFYGPKIDIKIKDALGRAWQCTTIQVDFNLPRRFDMEYIGEDGKRQQPIMIHRALLGSLERFFGILIEHYAGAFPVWLAPVQIIVMNITDNQIEYANAVHKRLMDASLRVDLDSRNEKIGKKIREAEEMKVPYMLIVGDKEVRGKTVSLRTRKDGDIGSMDIESFISKMAGTH